MLALNNLHGRYLPFFAIYAQMVIHIVYDTSTRFYHFSHCTNGGNEGVIDDTKAYTSVWHMFWVEFYNQLSIKPFLFFYNMKCADVEAHRESLLIM